jgi:hypothetical protein
VTVRKGPKREPKRSVVLLAACLFFAAGLVGAVGREGDGPAAGQRPGGRIVLDPSPGGRAVEPLLARLWASGFFRRNEAVRQELFDNVYAFFDEKSPVAPKGSKGLGCYSRGWEGKDTIFLRKDLFAYCDVGLEGVVIRSSVSRRVLPVLVHEICHDLCLNILDERERAAFAREGGEFMEEYRRAQTAEDKERFLLLAGDDISDPRCLLSYSGIDEILATHPPRALSGHELFAWLAERLFTMKAKIPRPLRKYYSCILAGVPADRAETPR